jgi:hypothetical protein
MSNVVPIAKFKVNDQVMFLEQTFDGDELVGSSMVGTRVIAREYTTELGWLYRVLGRDGYWEEGLFQVYDEAKFTIPRDAVAFEGGVYDVVEPLAIVEAMKTSPFKIGDYAKGLKQSDQNTLEPQYLLVIGCMWDFDIFSYDCAVLTDEGTFVDIQEGFYAEELEPVSPEAMADIIRERLHPKPKPKLALVHSS